MEKKFLVQIPAQIVDFRPRQDRSYKISFETREMTGEEVAVLANNFQGEGWLVFKPNGVEDDDIPEGDADAGLDSPSVRLRKKIYIYWKNDGERGDFQSFYLTIIEKLITYIDEKINREA